MLTDPMPTGEDDLWKTVLEAASHHGMINITFVVRHYKEKINDRPILRLLQDVNERNIVYSNILEEIKSTSARSIISNKNYTESGEEFLPDFTPAQVIKLKYEQLGLVPENHLPNPLMAETTKFVMDKLRRYSGLLLDLMANYAETIANEIKISPSVTVKFEVELGLPPALTIGIERERH